MITKCSILCIENLYEWMTFQRSEDQENYVKYFRYTWILRRQKCLCWLWLIKFLISARNTRSRRFPWCSWFTWPIRYVKLGSVFLQGSNHIMQIMSPGIKGDAGIPGLPGIGGSAGMVHL